jgi:hypothetical protein
MGRACHLVEAVDRLERLLGVPGELADADVAPDEDTAAAATAKGPPQVLQKACGALPPTFDCGSAASSSRRSRARLDQRLSLGPLRSLHARHRANDELARRNLLAHVLEFRLARFVLSLPNRCRHLRSLGS